MMAAVIRLVELLQSKGAYYENRSARKEAAAPTFPGYAHFYIKIYLHKTYSYFRVLSR